MQLPDDFLRPRPKDPPISPPCFVLTNRLLQRSQSMEGLDFDFDENEWSLAKSCPQLHLHGKECECMNTALAFSDTASTFSLFSPHNFSDEESIGHQSEVAFVFTDIPILERGTAIVRPVLEGCLSLIQQKMRQPRVHGVLARSLRIVDMVTERIGTHIFFLDDKFSGGALTTSQIIEWMIDKFRRGREKVDLFLDAEPARTNTFSVYHEDRE